MNLTTASVRGWAETILHQLGDPAGHTLDVTTTGPAREPKDLGSGAVFGSRLRLDWDEQASEPALAHSADSTVVVTLAYRDGSSISVLVDQTMGEAEAVALLADQLQDSVLENTGGAPVPPCPGHGHPAVAEVVNGIPSWVCPKAGGSRPILSSSAT
ncbi:hypothetical protein AB0I10_38230 [Streptomyces sp. NPDC050636]|uniref:hypothetical protein n=1 Tax=Streptomyces sp. NPDC050636 TaxID=3154510 RepID=UPI003412C82A